MNRFIPARSSLAVIISSLITRSHRGNRVVTDTACDAVFSSCISYSRGKIPGGNSGSGKSARIGGATGLLISKHLNHNGTSYAADRVKSRCVQQLVHGSRRFSLAVEGQEHSGSGQPPFITAAHSTVKKMRIVHADGSRSRTLVRSLTRFPRSLIMLPEAASRAKKQPSPWVGASERVRGDPGQRGGRGRKEDISGAGTKPGADSSDAMCVELSVARCLTVYPAPPMRGDKCARIGFDSLTRPTTRILQSAPRISGEDFTRFQESTRAIEHLDSTTISHHGPEYVKFINFSSVVDDSRNSVQGSSWSNHACR